MQKKENPVPTSVRIPASIDTKLEKIMEREHVPKTSLVIKAVEYLTVTDGNLTADGEYLKNIVIVGKNYQELTNTIKEQTNLIKQLQADINELRATTDKQNAVIDKLLDRIPR